MDKTKQNGPKYGSTLEPFYQYLRENWDVLNDASSTGTSSDSLFMNMPLNKIA